MANIDNVQLPDGSSYNIVDNTSGFATQNYVDSAVSSVTKTTIGLGNVDNTSDLNKPISTATQAALDTLDEDKADKTDIAPVEISNIASRLYAIGEQFYFNGQLVKATAIIAQGATITLNGNCAVSEQIAELIRINKSDISTIANEVRNSTSGDVATGITFETYNKCSVLNFNVTGSNFAPNAWTEWVTIAGTSLRPKKTSYAVVYLGAAGFGLLSIRTDGVVSVLNPNSNAATQLYGQIAIIN